MNLAERIACKSNHDIEPVGDSRADVETGKEEEEKQKEGEKRKQKKRKSP